MVVIPGVRSAAVCSAPYCEHIFAAALASNLPGLVWLRLGATRGGETRYQVLSFSDAETICIPVDIDNCDQKTTPLQDLDHLIARLGPNEPNFCGYTVAIPYGAAPACDDAMPGDSPVQSFSAFSQLPICLRRFDAAYVLDLQKHTAEFQFSADAPADRRTEFLQIIEELCSVPPLSERSNLSECLDFENLGCDFPASDYLSEVAELQEHIAAGELYECNFTQRFRLCSSVPPAVVARNLFAEAPARHACYIDFGDTKIICNSPEQFLRRHDSHIATCPIKGSITRASEPSNEQAQRNLLATSTKDHAEHTMVVDMARNDLGRLCRPGSVEVTVPYSIESHPALHHMVSTVEGELIDPDLAVSAILKATFPASSITGTPKIAAMKAIHQHERSPRGYYTGAVGLISRRHMDLSVSIRTIVATAAHDGRTEYKFGAGGAIVADSIPAEEHAECLAKAGPLLRAVQ